MDGASANYAAANLNVARDADVGRIVLFATTPGDTVNEEVDAFSLTVLFDPAIEKHHRKWSGSYHNHHNSMSCGFRQRMPEKDRSYSDV